MCVDGKCSWMEVETAAFIFSIVNIIIMTFGCLASGGALLYFNVWAKEDISATDILELLDYSTSVHIAVFIIRKIVKYLLYCMAAFFFTSFISAVYLIAGIYKRNPGYVKAYYIEGLIIICAEVIILAYIIYFAPICAIGITFIAIHGLILYMIRMTYKKFHAEKVEQLAILLASLNA